MGYNPLSAFMLIYERDSPLSSLASAGNLIETWSYLEEEASAKGFPPSDRPVGASEILISNW